MAPIIRKPEQCAEEGKQKVDILANFFSSYKGKPGTERIDHDKQ